MNRRQALTCNSFRVLLLTALMACGSETKDARLVDGGDTKILPNEEQFVAAEGKPDWCALCQNPGAIFSQRCPSTRPTTQDELTAICFAQLSDRQFLVVALGDCVLPDPYPHCDATTADPGVIILSFGSIGGGLNCHYSRATGALLGATAESETPSFCDGRTLKLSTGIVTNQWCQAGGEGKLSVRCANSDAL